MYGCYKGVIVFGFKELGYKNYKRVLIDWRWLEDKFGGDVVTAYATEAVRNYAGIVVYGFEIPMNSKGKVPTVKQLKTETQYSESYNALVSLRKILKRNNKKESNFAPLGYHVALSGDACLDEHQQYTPAEENDKNGNDDEDDDEDDDEKQLDK